MSVVTGTRETFPRDLRIDFFRGAALLVIFIEHFEILMGCPWLITYTLREYGPADGLNVFVFLSGFVFGLTHVRTIRQKGVWASQKKTMRRVAQIYLAQLSLYFFGLFLISWLVTDQSRVVHTLVFSEAIELPLNATAYAFVLFYQPFCLDILPLYIVILPFMPTILRASLNNGAAVIVGSYCVYSITQIWPFFNLPIYRFHPGRQTWLFDPFSWQFLFVIAMLISISSNNVIVRFFKRRSTSVITIGIVVLLSLPYLSTKFGTGSIVPTLSYISKTTLGPLRLVYSLCLVQVVAANCSANAAIWKSWIASPFVRCGKHSLEVFTFGVTLNYLCVCLISLDSERLLLQCIETCALVALIAFAHLLEWRWFRGMSRAAASVVDA